MKDILIEIGIAVFVVSTAFVAGLCVGWDCHKIDAANAGVAYYSCNPTNGQTSFHYIKVK